MKMSVLNNFYLLISVLNSAAVDYVWNKYAKFLVDWLLFFFNK